MKRLLFVIGLLGSGGAERVASILVNYFAQNGYEVRVLTLLGDRQDYKIENNVQVFPLLGTKIRFFRFWEKICFVRKHIKEFQPHCIVSFLAQINVATLIANSPNKYPVVVCERNDPNNEPSSRIMRFLRDRLYRKADGVLFQTTDEARYFDGLLGDQIDVDIIPNPLTSNLPYWDQNSVNSKRLITACRLNPQKNLPLMINAVADVLDEGVDCTLDIYGDGILHNELQKLIDKRNVSDKIFLRGFSTDLHQEVVTGRAFLMSSDYEGISNSMLEALAIGIPVVVTDCPAGGAKMFVEDGASGYLVPLGDRVTFREAVLKILENKQELRTRETAEKIRHNLDQQLICNRWQTFVDKIIEKKA